MTWSDDYLEVESRETVSEFDGPEPGSFAQTEHPPQRPGAPKTGRIQLPFGGAARARSAIDAQVNNLLAALARASDENVDAIVDGLRHAFSETPGLRLQEVVAEQLQKMKVPELQTLHSMLARRLLRPNCGRAIRLTKDTVVIALTERLTKDLDKRWSKMTVPELQTLHSLLAQRLLVKPCGAEIKAIHGKVIAKLESIESALSPLLQECLRSAIAEVGNTSQMTHFYGEALQHAIRLTAPRPGIAGTVVVGPTPHELIADVINYLLKEGERRQERGEWGGVELAHVDAFFMEIAGTELIAIAKSPGNKDQSKALTAAQDCLKRRGEEACESFDERVRELADAPQDVFSTSAGFANCLIAAGNHLGDLQTFSGISETPLTADDRDDLEEALQWFCDPANLGATGETGLSIAQLKQVSTAMGLLGFGAFQPPVDDEIGARRYVELATCKTIAASVLTGLRNLAKDGSKLADAMRILSRANDEFRSRGLSPQVFYANLREQAALLPLEARRAIANIMRGPRIGELSAALLEVRRMAAMQEFDGPRGLLDEIWSALNVVRESVDPAFKESAVADSSALGTLETLAPEVRAALEVFGIEVGTQNNVNVTLGVAARGIQEAVKQDLRKRMHAAGEQYKLVGKELMTPRVHESFSSAEYFIGDKPLINKADLDEFGHDDGALLKLRIERLRKLCGGDPAVLHALLNVASLDAMTALEQSFSTPESPFHLPDGTPGYPVGTRSYSFHLLADGKGGLAVRCELSITVTHLQIAGQEGPRRVKLNDSPARFAYAAAISPLPQLHVKVAKPLDMKCAAPVHGDSRWGYRVATSYLDPDTVAEIFAPRASAEPRSHFEAHIKSELSSENFKFITAVDELNADPTYARAVAIMKAYVLQSAENTVNLPSNRRLDIEAAFNSFAAAYEADERSQLPNDLIVALAAARHEIVALLQRDSYPRWLKKLRVAAEAEARRGSATPQDVATEKNLKPTIVQPPLTANPREKWLTHRLKQLSEPMASEADVNDFAMASLQDTMPIESSKGTELLVAQDHEVYWKDFERRVPEAYWTEFARRIQPHLDRMGPSQVAALRYNLATTLRPDQREHDRHIKVLLNAANAKLQGPRETRMTTESLVLEQAASIKSINLDLLAVWLKERSVNFEEARDAFEHLRDGQLLNIDTDESVDPRVVRVARTVRVARLQQLKDSGQDLVDALQTLEKSDVLKVRLMEARLKIHLDRYPAMRPFYDLSSNDTSLAKRLTSDLGVLESLRKELEDVPPPPDDPNA